MLVMGRYLLFKLQLWAYHKSFFESEFDTKCMFVSTVQVEIFHIESLIYYAF